MHRLSTAGTLDAFFAYAAAAPQRALLLDYDGTLAPFHPDRYQAFPYAGVREILTALIARERTRVVIVSGRMISDLVRLLGLDPLPELWGSHGWERRLPDGTYLRPKLSESAALGLQAAQHAAEQAGWGEALEVKPVGLAIHWRGLDLASANQLRSAIRQRWPQIAQESNLELHPFDGGIELRARGRDKGTAVETLRAELGAAALAFLGDDRTDEDAFQRIALPDLSVLVRSEYRHTAADLWLQPPDGLIHFLERWNQMDAGTQG